MSRCIWFEIFADWLACISTLAFAPGCRVSILGEAAFASCSSLRSVCFLRRLRQFAGGVSIIAWCLRNSNSNQSLGFRPSASLHLHSVRRLNRFLFLRQS
jgi:hypothetical protein